MGAGEFGQQRNRVGERRKERREEGIRRQVAQRATIAHLRASKSSKYFDKFSSK